MKGGFTNFFINETYSKPPKRNYPTNKILYNHIEETWSIELMVISGYKISINNGFSYIIVKVDNSSKYTWCKPLKYSQTKQMNFPKL